MPSLSSPSLRHFTVFGGAGLFTTPVHGSILWTVFSYKVFQETEKQKEKQSMRTKSMAQVKLNLGGKVMYVDGCGEVLLL
jgi:hypothetical protein